MKPRLSLLGLLTIIAVAIAAFIDPVAQDPGTMNLLIQILLPAYLIF